MICIRTYSRGVALCQAMVKQTTSDDAVLTNNCITVVADQTRKKTLLTSQYVAVSVYIAIAGLAIASAPLHARA